MTGLTTTYIKVGLFVSALLLLLLVAFRPELVVVQRGFNGTAMELVYERDAQQKIAAMNQVEEAPPLAPDVGPRAGQIYKNVKVLGHLSIGQFGRVMNALAAWVVPEDWAEKNNESNNCNYCHYPNNLASDGKYTKMVSRRMIQMTQHINSKWQSHVGSVGVTCYTCHRGNPVPQYIWFKGEEGPYELRHGLGSRAGQNRAGVEVGLSSLPSDPFSSMLLGDYDVHVNGSTPLPTGNRHSIKQAEWTYALMMHFSTSLGVNCTYCHNSRSMSSWATSPPTRVTAWYGIRMLRNLNQEYLEPLKPVYPEYRLGEAHGDAPKAYCKTCHQGAYKPLLGARMLDAYPSLAAPAPQPKVSVRDDEASSGVTALP